ncbi:MAG: GDSL-type esterase/lipase family protein, partial [Clostridiales bacterium]|nr:GDSL-type esterase/lipase family protein [Clostridiales bacterium]
MRKIGKLAMLAIAVLLFCASGGTTYAQLELTKQPEPVAWYEFDAESGTAAVDRVSGLSGKIVGTGYQWSNGSLHLKNAAQVIGETYVTIPRSAFVQPGKRDAAYAKANNLGSFTMSFWVNVTSDRQNERYLEIGDTSSDEAGKGYMYLGNSQGSIVWVAKGDSEERRSVLTVSAKEQLTGKGWRNIAITLDNSGQGVIYLDGAVVGSRVFPKLTSITLDGEVLLGRSAQEGINAYYGLLDDFQVYDQVLNPEQIEILVDSKEFHNPYELLVSDYLQRWNASLEFDGATSFEIDRPVQDDLSISFWINTTQLVPAVRSSYNGIQLFNADLAGLKSDFSIAIGGSGGTDGKIVFGIGIPGVGDRSIVGNTRINDGEWHHVVCERAKSHNRLVIYVDGRVDASGTFAGTSLPLSDSKFLTIGAKGDVTKSNGGNKGGTNTPKNQLAFVGTMSDIRFYGRYLAFDEAMTLNNAKAYASVPLVPRNASGYKRVMTMGDSITYGYSSTHSEEQTGGYRKELWTRLTQAGQGVEFVGRQTNGLNYIGSHNNEGWSGATIQEHLDNLDYEMAYNPDIITLMIGTNDIHRNITPEKTAELLDTLITRIFEKFGSNKKKLYVAKITKRDDSGGNKYMPRIDTYNSLIEGLVAKHKSQGKNIALADMYAPIESTIPDMFDGLHPSLSGYSKMGDVWFDAIKADFGITGSEQNKAAGKPVTESVETKTAAKATDRDLSKGWTAKINSKPSLTVDLGSAVSVKRVMTQFGYPKAGYYYKIETSQDGKAWEL